MTRYEAPKRFHSKSALVEQHPSDASELHAASNIENFDLFSVLSGMQKANPLHTFIPNAGDSEHEQLVLENLAKRRRFDDPVTELQPFDNQRFRSYLRLFNLPHASVSAVSECVQSKRPSGLSSASNSDLFHNVSSSSSRFSEDYSAMQHSSVLSGCVLQYTPSMHNDRMQWTENFDVVPTRQATEPLRAVPTALRQLVRDRLSLLDTTTVRGRNHNNTSQSMILSAAAAPIDVTIVPIWNWFDANCANSKSMNINNSSSVGSSSDLQTRDMKVLHLTL